MSRYRSRHAFLLTLVVVAFVSMSAFSADFRSVDITTSGYQDNSEKEHCIANYVLCFRDRDLERLATLFHEDFEWVVKKKSEGAEGVLSNTKMLFENVLVLGLEVGVGDWVPVTEVQGQPCDGCWETTRGYVLAMSRPQQGTAIQSGVGHFRFVVAPTENDGVTRYRIRVLEDIDEEEAPVVVVAPE